MTYSATMRSLWGCQKLRSSKSAWWRLVYETLNLAFAFLARPKNSKAG